MTPGISNAFGGLIGLAFGAYLIYCLKKIANEKGHPVLGNVLLYVWGATALIQIAGVALMLADPDNLFGALLVCFSSLGGFANFVLFLVTVLNNDNNNAQSEKSRKVDTLLVYFLGWAGVHRFYEGKIATGVVWLLTCGLCGIGWLIDIFIVISGSSKDKNGNPILRWN